MPEVDRAAARRASHRDEFTSRCRPAASDWGFSAAPEPATPNRVEELSVTVMLDRVAQGDGQAADKLLALVYDDLRRLAANKMACESAALTLQPTALVHEAWLRLGGEQQPAWQNRVHFFSAAAEAMRRILIDRARSRRAQRHGGGLVRLNAADLDLAAPFDDDSVLAVNEALEKFALVEPLKAKLVRLRYFAGLTTEEAAAALDIAAPTAKRWWAYARAWLQHEITGA